MYKFHASIHGVELNIPTDDSFVDLPLDEEQQKMLEKRKQDAFNRIKARSKKE